MSPCGLFLIWVCPPPCASFTQPSEPNSSSRNNRCPQRQNYCLDQEQVNTIIRANRSLVWRSRIRPSHLSSLDVYPTSVTPHPPTPVLTCLTEHRVEMDGSECVPVSMMCTAIQMQFHGWSHALWFPSYGFFLGWSSVGVNISLSFPPSSLVEWC